MGVGSIGLYEVLSLYMIHVLWVYKGLLKKFRRTPQVKPGISSRACIESSKTPKGPIEPMEHLSAPTHATTVDGKNPA